MGGHSTVVAGSSSACLMLWMTVSIEELSSSSEIFSMFRFDKSLYRFLTIVSSSISSLSMISFYPAQSLDWSGSIFHMLVCQ